MRSERVRKAPDRSWSEVFILRFEVEIVHENPWIRSKFERKIRRVSARSIWHPKLVSRGPVDRQQLLTRLEKAWRELQESYAGLPDSQMINPGVTGEWSVRDILAHVTTWEQKALKHLPTILKGRKPPRYSVTNGGINGFNRIMTEHKRNPESLPVSDCCYQGFPLCVSWRIGTTKQPAGPRLFRNRSWRWQDLEHFGIPIDQVPMGDFQFH